MAPRGLGYLPIIIIKYQNKLISNSILGMDQIGQIGLNTYFTSLLYWWIWLKAGIAVLVAYFHDVLDAHV